MNQTITKKTILTALIILITGFFAVQAWAHMGGGYHRGWGGDRPGAGYGGHMGYGQYHNGPAWTNLSDEDREKFQQERERFFTATQKLRNQYQEKRLALSNEYAKAETDPAEITRLEKELFDISAELEKARFEHRSKVREQFGANSPGFNRGGYGRGGYGGCF
ncbi:MAG: periplasmic heavy metal sensor [Desulfosudaceae bacterium]